MESVKKFKDGLWSKEINVKDFVSNNIKPYDGDASFLQGPTERTKQIWDICLQAIEEERANNGLRSLDNKQYQQLLLIKPDILIKRTNLS